MLIHRVLASVVILLVLVAPVLAQDTNTIYLPLLEKPAATSAPLPTATSAPLPTAVLQPTATPTPLPPSYDNCQAEPNSNAAPNYPVRIVQIDKGNETVTLQNVSGMAVDLSGWQMCSVLANQHHPIFGSLAPGESRVFDGPAGNIWNNSQQDDGALYDPQGSLSSYLVCTTLVCP